MISAFTVRVDPAALGLMIQALVSVRIRAGARHQVAPFAERLRELVPVQQFFFLAGTDDYLIHVALPDTASLRAFVLEQLSAHPAVAATHTSLIFEHER